MSQIVGKMLYLAMLKNSSKIPGSGSASEWLPKFTQFFHVHRHISFVIFMKMRSVVCTQSC